MPTAAARRLLGEGRHFHECRSIYAVIVHTACQPHKHSLNGTISKVLGHDGLASSLHYSCFDVTDLRKKRKFIFAPLM